jgi:hypothetical protein
VLANWHSKAKPFILPRESVKVTIVVEFSFFLKFHLEESIAAQVLNGAATLRHRKFF